MNKREEYAVKILLEEGYKRYMENRERATTEDKDLASRFCEFMMMNGTPDQCVEYRMRKNIIDRG